MPSRRHRWFFTILSSLLPASVAAVRAQDQPAAPIIRPLAPGVLTIIPTAGEEGETRTGPVPLVEITVGIPNLEWTPNFEAKTQTLLERAKRVTFYRPIWNLEFAFKPLRMLEIDIPQGTGKMQRKQIWYMVYRVQNKGYDLSPAIKEELPGLKTSGFENVNYPTRRFFPQFVLESHEFKKQYPDRVIPAAKKPIQARENPGVEIYNSVEITRVPIPMSDDGVDRSVWGYVAWEDLDPGMDFFSIYVRGLTNAFRFVDPAGAYQAGDPPGTGRQFAYKTLQLNFWRPGDTQYEHERELKFGVPIDTDPERQHAILDHYGLLQRLDYLWVYR